MAIWSQAQGLYHKAVQSPIATGWRRWGKFAWAIPFAAADITISRDKYAAVGANVADIAVAWALRKRMGALPFVLPPIAYAITRPVISFITGKHEIKGGTKITQRIASEVITIGESNKPVNPIKGHDAGHWGREQTFASGDFQPGASFVGKIKAVGRALKGFFAGSSRRASSRAMDLLQKGFSAAHVERLAKQAQGMSVEEFARYMKVDIKKLPEWAIAQTGGAFGQPARHAQWRAAQAMTGKFGTYEEFERFAKLGVTPGRSVVDPSIVSNLKKITEQGMPPTSWRPSPATLKEVAKEAEISVEHLQFLLKSRMPSSMKLGKTVQEQIQKTVIFHEAAEQLTYGTLASRFRGKELKRMLLDRQAHKMVIPQEELFMRTLGGPKETREFFQAFRAASDPWYAGFHSKYNTIEGLRHEGLAPQLRKMLTEFGSGWRGLRRILSSFMGKKAATQLARTGTAQEIFLKMSTSYRKELGVQFVQTSGRARSTVLPGGEIGVIPRIYLPKMDIIQQAYKTGKFTPEVYEAMRTGIHEMAEVHSSLLEVFGGSRRALRSFYGAGAAGKKQILGRFLPEAERGTRLSEILKQKWGTHASQFPIEAELSFAQRAGDNLLSRTIQRRADQIQSYTKFLGASNRKIESLEAIAKITRNPKDFHRILEAKRKAAPIKPYVEEMPAILERHRLRNARRIPYQENAAGIGLRLNHGRRASHGVQRPARRRS